MHLQKFKKILLITFLINAILVSTHQGEFWPFSIFPMFSKAGNPWSRGVIQQVEDTSAAGLWQMKPLATISDQVISLHRYNIDEIDFANFISKTKDWNQKRIDALRKVLQIEEHPGKMWMAIRVTGRLISSDSIAVEAIPMFLFTADTTYKNPVLFNKYTD